MVKIRNARSVALGLLATTCFVFGYMNSTSQINPFGFFLICYSIFFILNGIVEDHQKALIYIIVGVLMLISLLIMVFIQNRSITSLEIVVFTLISILSLVAGIGVQLGFLPTKLLKIDL